MQVVGAECLWEPEAQLLNLAATHNSHPRPMNRNLLQGARSRSHTQPLDCSPACSLILQG